MPEETLLELLEYANTAVTEDQERRLAEHADIPTDDKSDSLTKKEPAVSPLLAGQEKVRYRHIGQELFAGGQKRLEEVKKLLDFRRKMGRMFDKFTDTKLRFSVAQKVSYASKDALSIFKSLFATIVIIRGAFTIIKFVYPIGEEKLRILFAPQLTFFKKYWDKVKKFFSDIGSSVSRKFKDAGFGETKAAKVASIIIEEFNATFALIYTKLETIYNSIATDELTVLIETLSWATLGSFVGGPLGAGIGAVVGFVIGCLEVDDAAKQRMQTVSAVMDIQGTAKARAERA